MNTAHVSVQCVPRDPRFSKVVQGSHEETKRLRRATFGNPVCFLGLSPFGSTQPPSTHPNPQNPKCLFCRCPNKRSFDMASHLLKTDPPPPPPPPTDVEDLPGKGRACPTEGHGWGPRSTPGNTLQGRRCWRALKFEYIVRVWLSPLHIPLGHYLHSFSPFCVAAGVYEPGQQQTPAPHMDFGKSPEPMASARQSARKDKPKTRGSKSPHPQTKPSHWCGRAASLLPLQKVANIVHPSKQWSSSFQHLRPMAVFHGKSPSKYLKSPGKFPVSPSSGSLASQQSSSHQPRFPFSPSSVSG